MVAASWLEWWTAERAVAFATMGQLLVLLVAALVAGFQVREARRLREDQARPFVVVDFQVTRPPEIRLAITNLGKTMARDVRVSFDPPLQSSLDRAGNRRADLRMLNEPIPAMPPGKVYSTLFDVGLHDELPSRYMVTVAYQGDHGRQYPPDTFPLDLGLYGDLEFETPGTIKDLYHELHNIARTLDRWSASGIGGGLLALSPAEVGDRLTIRTRPTTPPPPAKVGPVRRLLEVAGRLRHRG
jgi:hypothetical protein